jgi:DNA (cytosine-5)-methyltransferase 1
MTAYYNENDPFAADWLRNLIRAGLVAPGDVDDRSIADVSAADLAGFDQHHFFSGIGGWSHALRLAGWPDDRPVWTGSCPCQPFSLAGKQRGFADDRHLWPVWRDLVAQCCPPVVFGEQVASAAAWLRLVRGDLEALGYAVGCLPVEAASAGAYHLRDRYWFVADADEPRLAQRTGDTGVLRPAQQSRARQVAGGTGGAAEHVAHADRALGQVDPVAGRREDRSGARAITGPECAGHGYWAGADGKARPVEPRIRLLAHGIPNRVDKLRGFGNAIDSRPAAAFITAFIQSREG